MIRTSETPASVGTALWIFTVLALCVMVYFMAMTAMIDLGAAAHDAFCPDHGWAV